MDYQNIFSVLEKNEIHIDYQMAKEPLALGTSKIGGKPHLPKHFEWCYYEGEDYDGNWENRPLTFLMQINCEEIKSLDKDNVLPEKGFLYFFYELTTLRWGFEPSDEGSARVLYFDGSADELEVRELPEELEEINRFPECALRFSTHKNIPSYEEFSDFYTDGDWDDYDEAAEEYGYAIDRSPDEVTKVLGYADLIQGSAVWECEMTARRFNCGNGPVKLTPEERAEITEASKDWILLAQFGTLTAGDTELMWGDCGCLYFFIRKKDLAKKNFENIWMVLQCG